MDNETMNITSAVYSIKEDDQESSVIKAVIDGETLFVPLEPRNRHYAEIMRQVDAGTLTIEGQP